MRGQDIAKVLNAHKTPWSGDRMVLTGTKDQLGKAIDLVRRREPSQ